VKVKSLSRFRGRKLQSIYLLSELVTRDLKARYVGSTFGPAWAFLVPLVWVLIYSFVFSVVLKIPLTGEPAGVNFPEYLLAGFLPWLAVQEGVSRSATCLTDNAAMVKKTVFLKESLVATVVLSAVFNELIGFGLYAAYLLWRGHLSASWIPVVAALIVVQVVITYGLGCLLAGLHVFLRDISQIVVLGLGMMSFLTPIFYSANMVPRRFHWVVQINPFAHLIEAFRDAFFRHRLPAAGSLAYLAVFAIAAVTLGSVLFTKTEPHFADLL
jgi:ABC-type polysaccharide/polyol phosphate export systems, permease component